MIAQSVLSKLAAAGFATKAAAAGATFVVAASAAGATDALPTPAQDAFDRIVATDSDDSSESTESTESSEEAPETSNADDAGEFGARVSQDATGESDGTPGVDGPTIACEASEGRSGTCEDDTDGDVDTEDGETGEGVSEEETDEDESGVDGRSVADEVSENGGPEGTPGEGAADDHRPSDDD